MADPDASFGAVLVRFEILQQEVQQDAFLAGTWNDLQLTPMSKCDADLAEDRAALYYCEVSLLPGIYSCMYKIDGNWFSGIRQHVFCSQFEIQCRSTVLSFTIAFDPALVLQTPLQQPVLPADRNPHVAATSTVPAPVEYQAPPIDEQGSAAGVEDIVSNSVRATPPYRPLNLPNLGATCHMDALVQIMFFCCRANGFPSEKRSVTDVGKGLSSIFRENKNERSSKAYKKFVQLMSRLCNENMMNSSFPVIGFSKILNELVAETSPQWQLFGFQRLFEWRDGTKTELERRVRTSITVPGYSENMAMSLSQYINEDIRRKQHGFADFCPFFVVFADLFFSTPHLIDTTIHLKHFCEDAVNPTVTTLELAAVVMNFVGHVGCMIRDVHENWYYVESGRATFVPDVQTKLCGVRLSIFVWRVVQPTSSTEVVPAATHNAKQSLPFADEDENRSLCTAV